MSKNKNYNSIVFLTTLSVYLGLVLSGGATPSVWAQSKTITVEERLSQDKDFRRIVEECGKILPRFYRKSIDKTPFSTYTIEDFVNALVDLSKHSNCTSPDGFAFVSTITYPSSKGVLSISTAQKPYSKGTWISGSLISHIEAVGNSLPHTFEVDNPFFTIDFELDKTNLVCLAKFRQQSESQAEQIALLYNDSLIAWKTAVRNKPEFAIYENTKITFENNQVFIVTRLPRASIDSLIAQKNAR